MINFVVNESLSYYEIQDLLLKNNIFYYIDKSKNIVLLENKNERLIYPHKMYISKNLSLYIDRYCSYDIFKILTLLVNLIIIDIIDLKNM